MKKFIRLKSNRIITREQFEERGLDESEILYQADKVEHLAHYDDIVRVSNGVILDIYKREFSSDERSWYYSYSRNNLARVDTNRLREIYVKEGKNYVLIAERYGEGEWELLWNTLERNMEYTML